MKKTIFAILLLLLSTAMVQAQGLTKFFDKYAEDERFSYARFETMQTLSLEITPANKTFAETLEKEVLEIMKNEKYILNVASREKSDRSYIYSHPKGESVIMSRDKKEWSLLWTVNPTGKKSKPTDKELNTSELEDKIDLGKLNAMFNDSAFFKKWKNLGKVETAQLEKELKNMDKCRDSSLLKRNNSELLRELDKLRKSLNL